MGRLEGRELKVFLTVFLLAGLFVHWSGVNEVSRFSLTMSMVDEGTANINEYYWKAGDRSYYEGNYYSDKEPGMAFLATPIYSGWKTVYTVLGGDTNINKEDREPRFQVNDETIYSMADPGDFYLSSLILVVLFTSTLSLAILSVLIYRLSGDFLEEEAKRLLLTFGFAFGTIVTNYGTNFMPNAVVTLFSFSSFYLVYKSGETPSWKYLTAAGLLGGIGVMADPTAAPVVGAVFLYSLYKYRDMPYYLLLGNFIGVLPMLIYNTAVFGYPWMLPRFFLDPALFPQLQQSSSTIPQLMEQGFRIEPVELMFILKKLFFYPHRGIFYWFPILILSFWGLKELVKEKKGLAFTTGLVLLSTALMVASWWAWWMGGFFGARYLSVAIPFLMFPIFYGAKKMDVNIIAILVIVSVIINLSGFHGHYEDKLKDLDNASEIQPQYQDKVKSFQSLSNPLGDYYLPGLIEHGPESKILTGLYNKDFPPDIRSYNNYEERAPLPLLFWSIILITTLVWRKDISRKLMKHRKKVLSEIK